MSQHLGYSRRKKNGEEGDLLVHSPEDIARAFRELRLDDTKIMQNGIASELAKELSAYFALRASVLRDHVLPRLMNAQQARDLFQETRDLLNPKCPIPMNKQKGVMRAESYLTALVNMTIESNIGGLNCDYDPRELTTVTRDGLPLRTLARRVDGAFPSTINPIAVWEIKEYYYTTTFGSRVADGVYETLLDGMELEDLSLDTSIEVKHYLMIDAKYTWWDCGRSYLCRIFDMLHMGYVDEVLVGREVVDEMPRIAKEWVDALQNNRKRRLVDPDAN